MQQARGDRWHREPHGPGSRGARRGPGRKGGAGRWDSRARTHRPAGTPPPRLLGNLGFLGLANLVMSVSPGLAHLTRTAATTKASRALKQTTPPAAPGPRSSSSRPIVERPPLRFPPLYFTLSNQNLPDGKAAPLSLTRARARAPSCPTRGGSRPRGDARSSGVRAQLRTML